MRRYTRAMRKRILHEIISNDVREDQIGALFDKHRARQEHGSEAAAALEAVIADLRVELELKN